MTVIEVFLAIGATAAVFTAGWFSKQLQQALADWQEEEAAAKMNQARQAYEEAEAAFPNSPAMPLVPNSVAVIPDWQKRTQPMKAAGMPLPDNARPVPAHLESFAAFNRELTETTISAALVTPYPPKYGKPSASPLATFDPDTAKPPAWLDLVGPEKKMTTTDVMYFNDLFAEDSQAQAGKPGRHHKAFQL